MVEDKKLTEHYSLYDLTKTSHVDLQDKNRILTEDQVTKLSILAVLVEEVRMILDVPVVNSSAYRCPELNKRVGSTVRSQHLLCEAADCVPKGMAVDEAFRKLRQAIKDKKLRVGQLIYEKTNGREGLTEWIHVSLGHPYRDWERSGQILTMTDGVYSLVETVAQNA